jgi:endo-1,4-beta-xylanase
MMESLKEKYRDYFEVGTAVSAKTVISHGDLIRKHFSSITCENEMKYASVTAGKDFYDFKTADMIAEFAAVNNLTMRGHTFVWHNQTPHWVFEDTDKAGLLKRIRNHMAMLGGRYKEQISCWDVVNEAVEDKQDMFLRQSKWLEILGEGFMDEVFLAAREILPDCKLFYNDYNETNPDKRSKIFRIVKGMKDREIPIDGIGMQCHWNIYGPSLEEVRKTIEMYASLGVRLHITELDISLFEFNDRSRLDKPSGDILEKQAVVFDNYFKLFREYREVIDSVTLWGAADDSTWLDNFPERGRKNCPLLFDEDHNPKEAFYRIMNF